MDSGKIEELPADQSSEENELDEFIQGELISPEEFEAPEDLDTAIDRTLAAKGLAPSGDKIQDLNEIGRGALNGTGATIEHSARVLTSLSNSNDEKIALGAAKFIFERHAGRLDNSNKDNNGGGIVINIGQQFVSGQPNIFNPDPERKQIA